MSWPAFKLYEQLKNDYSYEIVQLEMDDLRVESLVEVRLLEVCLKQQRMLNSLLPDACWTFKKEGEQTIWLREKHGCTKEQALKLALNINPLVDDSWTILQGLRT